MARDKVFTLIESIFHDDGTQKITEKGFDTKSQLLKALRKYAPVTNKVINDLSKRGEVEFEYGEKRRKFQIIEDNE